jgi:hypothetical protein
MLIIIDKKIPAEAKEKISIYGTVVEFFTTDIVYDAISGHPDIFFCQTPQDLIVAPDTPISFINILKEHKIKFKMGKLSVGKKYPETARYNAVVTDNFLIHHSGITDEVIKSHTSKMKRITVMQAYTRCNLLPLKNDHFITSDLGIHKAMNDNGCKVLYISPDSVLLSGFDYGFFGGASGVYENKVFIIGSLQHYHDGEKVRNFLSELQYEIIELYDEPLFDGGSVLFLP